MERYKQKEHKKHNFIVFLMLALFIIGLFVYHNVIDLKLQNTQQLEENHLNGDGVYFNVFTEETRDEIKTGIFSNIDNDTVFYASIQNQGKPRYVSISGYLNYFQTQLVCMEEGYDCSSIYLEDGANLLIPFKIADPIEKGANYKFLISLFLGIDQYECDNQYQSTEHTISYDFFLKNDPDSDNVELEQYTIDSEILDNDFSGIMLNTDFTGSELVKLPPYNLKVTAGKMFDLAYRIGNNDASNQTQLILVTIDYQQVLINGKNYLLTNSREGCLSYGTITLKAPETKGKNEICALVVPDPNSPTPFFPLENSCRFTLTTE